VAPFVCLYEHCDSGDMLYTSKHTWLEHLRANHLSLVWNCSQCLESGQPFIEQGSFRKHVKEEHGDPPSTSELNVIAEFSQQRESFDSCLICGATDFVAPPNRDSKHPVDRQSDVINCMVRHLETLAVASFPWHQDGTSGVTGSNTRASEGSRCAQDDEKAKPGDHRDEGCVCTVGYQLGNHANEVGKYFDGTVDEWLDSVELNPPEQTTHNEETSMTQDAGENVSDLEQTEHSIETLETMAGEEAKAQWTERRSSSSSQPPGPHPPGVYDEFQHSAIQRRDQDSQIDFNKFLMFERMDHRYHEVANAKNGSCQWLFQVPEYKTWLETPTRRDSDTFLWIRGKPASGKSILMKHAVRHSKTLEDCNVLYYFFHSRGHFLEMTLEGMFRSLLVQICEKIPRLQGVIRNYYPRMSVLRLQNAFHEAVMSLGGRPRGVLC
jgi:hypothetical protein